jgi:malic enzyme
MESFMCLARYYPLFCSLLNKALQHHADLSISTEKGSLLISSAYLKQANNAYIFPGFGLGLVISGAIRVHEDMLLAACKYCLRGTD